MKFIYFQDGHLKAKNPINRKGDYFSDWIGKFTEFLAIAVGKEVDGILDGGDLFDTAIVSYRACDTIVDMVEKTNIPYYCLFGNHSQLYHSNENSYETTLAHILRRSKSFHLLNQPLSYKDFEILGVEYKNGIEEEIKENGIIVGGKDIWKIAIVHAFICPEKFPFCSHVVCDDITADADLVLVAHYHKPWEKKVGKTQYLDIGCFGRNSITEKDVHPSCVLLDTEKRSYEIIKLNSAKKAEDCFNLEAIHNKKEFNSSLEEFVKSLESVSYQGERIQDIVKKIAKETKVDKEVTDLITSKISEVENV